jgi:predicted RNA binding protein YcfA (HicA-like mRNA interferase family)
VKYRDFRRLIEDQGFRLVRERATHKQFEGFVGGQRRLVTLDYAQPGEDISPRNLASMIRQSGLDKKLFR